MQNAEVFQPWPYQVKATEHIINNHASGLLLDMGLGKSLICLTAVVELFKRKEINKVLVIGPLRVARHTWPTEIGKWAHTKNLSYSVVTGTERARKQALAKKVQIYIINRENVPWLVTLYGLKWPFDFTIIDESSSFKNPASRRFKELKKVRPLIKRVVILTGTPIPNGLIDLWSQLYLLDMGERLGETITEYRRTYFNEGEKNGHVVYNYKLKKLSKNENLYNFLGPKHYENIIYSRISDICISMKAKDYLQLPELIERTVPVYLTPDEKKRYDDFETESILEFINERGIETVDAITAANAAALTNKLLQYANGAVYSNTLQNREYHEVHDQKLEALAEILETAIDQGHNVLLFYSFKHDLERIRKRFKQYRPQVFESDNDSSIDAWNEGKIKLMCAHPLSAGHGLNIQKGGHIIVWYGLPWSLESYMQAVARLHRQGQIHNVIVHRLLTKGTLDYDVLEALAAKNAGQERLMSAVKAKVSKVLETAQRFTTKNKLQTSKLF